MKRYAAMAHVVRFFRRLDIVGELHLHLTLIEKIYSTPVQTREFANNIRLYDSKAVWETLGFAKALIKPIHLLP